MSKLIALFLVGLSIQLQAQSIDAYIDKTDVFFKTYVSDGLIDYAGIAKNPGSLNELIEMAGTMEVSQSDAKNYQAFWINTYNLTVIKGIVNNYPLESPLAVNGFFDQIKYSLGGKDVTLNDIENNLLRKNFSDPRFHFVLVCGAIGCPPIINQAYKPSTLDSQLSKQTKAALNGDLFIQINEKKKRVVGSEILKWYKEDFTMNGQSEIDFINEYRATAIPTNFKLSYSTYNWALNAQ